MSPIDDVPDLRLWPNRLKLVAELLGDIADPEYQRRQWVEGRDPTICSSMGETLAMLLDDFDLADTIRLGVSRHGWSPSDSVAVELGRLRSLLMDLPSTFGHIIADEQAIDSPPWRLAVDQARRAVAALRPLIPPSGPVK